MQATKEKEALLKMIRPPRVEDAGLEDCALPPEAIKEAFLKAASSLRSSAESMFSANDDDEVEGGGCVEDPRPSNGETWDALTGGFPENPATCGEAEKGGLPKGSGDGEGSSDKVVGAQVPEMEEGRKGGCVEGLLEDLEIGDKGDFENEEDSDEDEKLEDTPTLV
ncbi:hypothetical protein ACLOJK_040277 [Asimina triloba]